MSEHCCGPSRGEPAQETNSSIGGSAASSVDPLEGFVDLPGGPFLMGSEDALSYPQDGEGPVRRVTVPAFSISATAVSVAQFAAFVEATGYLSDAERFGDSLVFAGQVGPGVGTPVREVPWWRQVAGASWRHPEGPGSDIAERADHPVTHVSQRDAIAYTRWSGTRLLSEAEWEYAARAGLEGRVFPWGDDREPDGVPRMNTFTGEFPDGPTAAVGPVPVDSYEPNGFGLFNMTGNVWEWTASTFSRHDSRPVLRGGSFLCHDSYCRRYRNAARIANTPDTSLGHTGFRVALAGGARVGA